jgi:hypothetical protein
MAKTFNLNDASYDASGSAVFNNGVAGVVDNCKAKVERVKQEDKENPNAPDYKIVFVDNTGADINIAFWYPKEDDSDENIIRFLKKIKHLAHCFCGTDTQLPSGSPRAILDGVMKMIKDTGMQMPVRVMTNYGTTGYESRYIRVRNFVPFVEPMTVPKDETRLKPSNIENFERPASEETTGAVSSASAKDSDWD